MKTAQDKAEQWLDDNVPEWTATQFRALTVLLKEQDRDTRHACAEAVVNCDDDVSGECIWKDDAHSACINAIAV